jgi:hypothetical protein
MPGNPPFFRDAGGRFPVRVVIAVPPGGFGQWFDLAEIWLNENCGSDGWVVTPVGDRRRAVPLDTVAIYLRDATVAAAFVSRWCAAEVEGVYQVRDDEPERRVPVADHKTPRVK